MYRSTQSLIWKAWGQIHFVCPNSPDIRQLTQHIYPIFYKWICWPVLNKGFPGGTSSKDSAHQYRRHKRHQFDPWVGKIPWKTAWQPTLVFLPGESHGQRSLVGHDWNHLTCRHTFNSLQFWWLIAEKEDAWRTRARPTVSAKEEIKQCETRHWKPTPWVNTEPMMLTVLGINLIITDTSWAYTMCQALW